MVLNERTGNTLNAGQTDDPGLVTIAYDVINWEEEVRFFVEGRASFSPDGLTGMEANLRFSSPESMRNQDSPSPVGLAELAFPTAQRLW